MAMSQYDARKPRRDVLSRVKSGELATSGIYIQLECPPTDTWLRAFIFMLQTQIYRIHKKLNAIYLI